MKNQKTKNKQDAQFFKMFREYFKENLSTIILLLITLVLTCLVSFFKISTASTVASYNIDEYEIGQIADVTIKASKTLPPTFESPVSVEKDEKIIRKGFPITEEQYAKLRKMADTTSYFDGRAFANTIMYHILMEVMFFFLFSGVFFRRKLEFKEIITECIFYLAIYTMAVLAAKTIRFSDPFALGVIVPSSLCTLLVTILFGQLNGLFFSILISFGVLNATSYQLIPFLYIFSTSLCSVRIVRNVHHRSNMVPVSLLQALLNIVFIMLFKLIFNYPLRGSLVTFAEVAGNGLISGILCLGLLTPFELLLNTASPFRLTDLSDTSNPIFEEMKIKANGTFSHCQNVATLAEAACREIGANGLLARVGAQYHDIGKLDNPEYFTENQVDGENIHDRINPTLSISVIRSHVKRGVERAYELRLPKQVIDIIAQHHGNQVIEYFYNEAVKVDQNINPADYSYNGNPPETKESAIVMLADTVEAATRALKNKSVPSLDKFIWQLINKKIETHQLMHSDLTYAEITKIHDAFLQILTGIYHSRIVYPDQKENESKIEKEIRDEKKTEASAEEEKSVEKKSDKTGEFKKDKTGEFKKDKTGEFKKDKTGEFKKDKTGEFKKDKTGEFKKDKTLVKSEKKSKTEKSESEEKTDSADENKTDLKKEKK